MIHYHQNHFLFIDISSETQWSASQLCSYCYEIVSPIQRIDTRKHQPVIDGCYSFYKQSMTFSIFYLSLSVVIHANFCDSLLYSHCMWLWNHFVKHDISARSNVVSSATAYRRAIVISCVVRTFETICTDRIWNVCLLLLQNQNPNNPIEIQYWMIKRHLTLLQIIYYKLSHSNPMWNNFDLFSKKSFHS